jgi:hypothetical protein
MFSPAELAVLRTLRGSLEAIAPSLVPSIDLLLSGSLAERRSRQAVNQANLRERERQRNDNASATQEPPKVNASATERTHNGNGSATGGKGGALGSSLVSSGSPSLPVSVSLVSSETEAQSSTREKTPRATRLPKSWVPSAELVARLAETDGVNASATTESFRRFRLHYAAKSGKFGLSLDWDASYEAWIVEDKRRGQATLVPDAQQLLPAAGAHSAYDIIHHGERKTVT